MIQAVANKVAVLLNLNPDHIAVAIVAAAKSTYITGAAIACGLTTDAYFSGAHTPQDFLAYYKAHWIGWIITNLIAPTWRASEAYKKAQKPPDSPLPSAV